MLAEQLSTAGERDRIRIRTERRILCFKRATLILIMVVMALLPLSMTVNAQNPDCEGDVTLTYWHHWGGNRIPLQEHQVAAFEDAHPGICVDVVFLPWDNRLQNLLAVIAAGNPAGCNHVWAARPALLRRDRVHHSFGRLHGG